jgi:RNA polymerase sigma-70 factor (ECF subfamily)
MTVDAADDKSTWEDLLTAVAADRDKEAFAKLFGHFAPRVKAYLMRGGSPPAMAEDIAQETFVAVWRKAHLYDRKKASASTWLFTIARNQRIDRIRRERRPEPDPNDPSFAPDPVALPDREVSAQQDMSAVRLALKTLPEAQREVVMMSFFEDKSHSVIADDLQLPIGTVKSRIRLALKRLDTILDRGAHGEYR